MATILWDGRHLVADSRVNFCGQKSQKPEPKIFALPIEDGAMYVAYAGANALMRKTLVWLRDGADPNQVPALPDGTADFEVIAVRKLKGCSPTAFLALGGPLDPLIGWFALGTGREFALGALAGSTGRTDGATSLTHCQDAVNTAAKFDTRSGGPVGWVDTGAGDYGDFGGVVVQIFNPADLCDQFYHFTPESY